MFRALHIGWMFATGLAFAASAQDDISTIAVPISVPLGDIERYINIPGRLPVELHFKEEVQTCVEPEQVCTKVPEFRGLKITFKDRCVDISPRIRCTVTEQVQREGPMRISGDDGTIRVTQTVVGSGRVRGRGEIGRHIRQTARATAEFTIEGRPALRSDWTPVMPVNLSHRWIDPPEIRLFNLFPVTFRSKVEPRLKAALSKYDEETLPAEIAKIDVRGKAALLWRALQDPHPIDLAGERLYLHVTPLAVGLDGPRFDDGALTARLAVSARLQLREDDATPAAKVPLPNLTPAPAPGYRVVVPVKVGLETLAAQVRLPADFDIEAPVSARVTVKGLRLSSASDGRLQAVLEVDARRKGGAPGMLGYEGAVTITALPLLDPATGIVRLENPEIAAGTPEEPMRILGVAIRSGLLGQWLLSELTYDSGPDVRRAEDALNAALNREIVPGLRLAGKGALDVSELRIEDSVLTLFARSTGEIRVTGFDPTSR